jgi:hypothetical protein
MPVIPSPIPDNYIVLRAGKFDTENGAGIVGLTRIFSQLATTKPPHVAIHFHGGLVSRPAAEAAAARLMPLYFSAGVQPLFFIWETGWEEILQQNLPSIFSEDIFKRVVRRVSQFVKGKLDKELGDGEARGIGGLALTKENQIQRELDKAHAGGQMFEDTPAARLPADTRLSAEEQQQILDEIQADQQLEAQLQEIANARQQPTEEASRSATAQGSTATLMSPDVLDDVAPVQEGTRGLISTVLLAKHVVAIVGNVIIRLARHRDHGVYLTIVEEVMREFYVRNAGKFLWDGMKKEVDEAFGTAGDCGGTAFVSQLKNLWAQGVRPRITLVGHSAGSIYVSRLLKELDRELPADFKVDVIFLAPACTFAVFADAIKWAGKRIGGLRIFGMGNAIEMQDAIAGVAYPASLLYFVSGVLEDQQDMPLLGMQRYYDQPYDGSGFEDLAFARAFEFMRRKNALVWSDAKYGDGSSCDMRSHGGWVDAPATLASVLSILRKGYGYV